MLLFVGLTLYINLHLFHIRFSFSSEMRIWFRSHISFGSRGLLSGVLIGMNTRVDVMMIGYFMTDRMVGIYSLGATFAEGLAQLSTVMRRNVDPIVGRCFAEDNRERIREFSRKIRHVFVPAMALLGGTLVAFFPVFLKLIASGDKASESWGVFAILVGGIVLASPYRPFIGTLLQGGRPGAFTMLIAGTLICNAVLTACLISGFGIYGAAVATALVYVLEAMVLVVLVRKLFGIYIC